jgi:hypothetical protein
VAKNKAGEMVDILFKWKEDRKFEIYLYENEILSSNPVVSGYYENDEKVAVLTLEYNVLFDENTTTITLLGDV